MAKVFFGGGLFILDAVTTSVTMGAEASLLSGSLLVLTALGVVPTAWAVAQTIFHGDGPADLSGQLAE